MNEYLNRIEQNARELHEISKLPDLRPGLADKIRYRADAIVAQVTMIRQLPTPVDPHAAAPTPPAAAPAAPAQPKTETKRWFDAIRKSRT